MTPTPTESEALDSSGGLLRYAAENKEVPPDVISALSEAWGAKQNNTWDDKIATRFWVAFNSLCLLIRPVTMNTLSANLREIPQPSWKFWIKNPVNLSLSRRSAARYLVLLICLLTLSVVFGFFAATEAKLSADINKLIDEGTEVTEAIAREESDLETKVGPKKFADLSGDERKSAALIQSQLQKQWFLASYRSNGFCSIKYYKRQT